MNQIAPLRLGPGIHANVPESLYHRDPCIEISASSSVLKVLYQRSPRHAWNEHARLNPAWEPSASSDAKDRGSILHALVLGQPAPHRVLNFKDYRTDAAKAARDAARNDGLIPILGEKMDELMPVVAALRSTLESDYPELLEALTDPETLHEATVIARVNGVLCRTRYDALPPARFEFSADLKFTGREAEPEAWARRIRDDYLFSAALYPQAVEQTRGDAPEFRFIVCEWDPPYAVSVHAADPTLAGNAKRQLDVALRRWDFCLRNNVWPSYPPLVHYAEAPTWWLVKDEIASGRDAFIDDLIMVPPLIADGAGDRTLTEAAL